MEKKNLDWSNIGFTYMTTDKRYVSNFKNGKWDAGALTEDSTVVLNECAGILQYCQECFEGLKAYTTADGSIVTFRPDLNAERSGSVRQRGLGSALWKRRNLVSASLHVCHRACDRSEAVF